MLVQRIISNSIWNNFVSSLVYTKRLHRMLSSLQQYFPQRRFVYSRGGQTFSAKGHIEVFIATEGCMLVLHILHL